MEKLDDQFGGAQFGCTNWREKNWLKNEGKMGGQFGDKIGCTTELNIYLKDLITNVGQ